MERTLFLNGTIAEESWFDDDITPALFKEELMAGSGNITVWIANSSKRGHILRTNGALSPFLTVRSTIPLMIVAYFSASRMLMPFISSR